MNFILIIRYRTMFFLPSTAGIAGIRKMTKRGTGFPDTGNRSRSLPNVPTIQRTSTQAERKRNKNPQ